MEDWLAIPLVFAAWLCAAAVLWASSYDSGRRNVLQSSAAFVVAMFASAGFLAAFAIAMALVLRFLVRVLS